MQQGAQRAYFGPYKLLRPLPDGRFGKRWLAVHARQHSSHVVTTLRCTSDRAARRRLALALQRAQAVTNPHILAIEHASFDASGDAWMVSPYLGNQDQLVDIHALLDMRGGRLSIPEVEHAAEHLLSAIREVHEADLAIGALTPDQILVDRHGCIAIEHPGLAWLLKARDPQRIATDDEKRDDLRAAAEIIYLLLTGLRPDQPIIPATRVVRRLSRQWDTWFHDTIEREATYPDAGAMLAALREVEPARKPPSGVRVVLSRLRGAPEISES